MWRRRLSILSARMMISLLTKLLVMNTLLAVAIVVVIASISSRLTSHDAKL